MADQLASSSSLPSSSLPPSWRYDLFLSFRGEDTRTSFTDHLYKALVDKGINTFIDRQLTRGEEISLALLQAIEESRISLVIFSKNYGSSRWCLDELVKIHQCKKSNQQIVLPVFYKVDPSHVRNQTSSFGVGFAKLQGKFKDNKKKVLMWRSALREVANLSGHPFRKGDSEATFISNIVEDILVKVLDDTYLNVAKHPVGIQSCVQEVKELLGVGGNNRCVVGIWGISGIGKTTIAKAVYNAIAHKFEGRCFLADVVQQVFLDIACFFKGEHKDYVLQILKSSKLNVPQDCIEVLVENAIITIEDNRILMHDLLEKMGKHIVYEESPTEPGKRSRLWFHEDVHRVLTENRGTKKIKGIVVELPQPDVITLNAESFLRMRRHRVVFNLPSNYHPRHLAGFDVSYSGIRPLKEFKNLAKLTNMNLSGCKFFEKIPDLSGSPNLKHLVLRDCKSLVEVDDSVGFLDKLVELNLDGCSKLTRFVTRLGSRSLGTLSLRRCARLESFPEIEKYKMESLMYLDIQESGIRELPSSIAYLTWLLELDAKGCENLTGTSLHHIYGLQYLSEVHFCECPKLVTFGKNKVKFDKVSSSSTESQLLSTGLETSQDNCSTFALPNLYELYLEGCNLSESDFLVPLHCWDTLTWLDLSRNNFVSLPDCISKFVNLKTLYLTGCKRLREIPQLFPPNLKYLYLADCTSLEKTPKLPPMLECLDLTNCYRLSGDEVAKLENNLLNEGSLRCPGLKVIYPGNEVPKWFSYTSNHPTTIEHLPEDDEKEEFVGGSEFCFEIPLNLQGETLLGLALSVVLDAPVTNPCNSYILINRFPWFGPNLSCYEDIEATHVWLKVLDLNENEQRRDICQVIFRFRQSARIKRCGVHLLRATKTNGLPNEYSWEEASSLEGADIFHGAYDHQEQ